MHKAGIAIVVCALLGSFCARSAYGDPVGPITVGYYKYGTYGGTAFNVTRGTQNIVGGAGLFSLTYTDPKWDDVFVQVNETGPGVPPRQYIASFCIDLDQYIFSSGNTYDIVDLDKAPSPYTFDPGGDGLDGMDAAKADQIARLWREEINNNADGFVDDSSHTSLTNAAFQLSLWEILYETSGIYDIKTGSFKANMALTLKDAANSMLAWVVNPLNAAAPKATLKAFSAPTSLVPGVTRQDQVVEWIPPEGSPSVPEPGTIISLATMCGATGAFVGLRRTRKRLPTPL